MPEYEPNGSLIMAIDAIRREGSDAMRNSIETLIRSRMSMHSAISREHEELTNLLSDIQEL